LPESRSIQPLREPRRARAVDAAALWTLAALSPAWLATPCIAADSMSGLGSAFRPQSLPTVPLAASAGERTGGAAGLRVLVLSPSRSLASIDGQVVHVGDTVNGMRVTRIDQQGVVLTGEGGATEQLTIAPSVVKRKAVATPTSARVPP
jgi:hypothetical protein